MKNKYFWAITGLMIFSMTAACDFGGQSGKQIEANSPVAAETDASEADIVKADTSASEMTETTDAGDDDSQESAYKLTDSMLVAEAGKLITQTDSVNGITYSLTVNLENAAGYTSEEQIITCTKVFWYCYPKMYEKMAVEATPLDVNLIIEDQGYEIAEQWDNNVHLHDRWLSDNPEDFDCLTHEFAHVIQTNWEGDYSPHYGEDTYLIERFADACRYMYAYENGLYNDEVWTLWTASVECDYASSVRFWVWIEQTFSDEEIDIFARLVRETQIKDEDHEFGNWESGGRMWDVIFEGTDAEGRDLDELWLEFLDTDFAWEA